MILVSACLLGLNCKYNGKNNKNNIVVDFVKDKNIIPICPEQLGGLSTPRLPSELQNGDGYSVLDGEIKVLDIKGKDVTENFINGSEQVKKLIHLYDIKYAILKEGSPSCGVHYVYDGSFNGCRINGMGVTTACLLKNNIKIYSENEIE